MALLGTAIIVSLAAGGLSLSLLTMVAWWNRRQPGVLWFAFHAGLVAVWSFAGLAALIVDSASMTILFSLVGNGLGLAVSISWFLFIVEYLGEDLTISRRLESLALGGIGGLYFLVYATSGQTGMMVRDLDVMDWQGLTVFVSEPAPLGGVSLLAGFSLFFVGLALIVRTAAVGDRLYAMQGGIIFVATVLPVVSALLVAFLVVPAGVPAVQLTATLSSFLYAFALWRYEFFALIPATERIGIKRAFDDLDAGVVITTATGRILHANRTVADIFEISPSSLSGRPAETVFDVSLESLPTLVEAQGRVYRLTDSSITDDNETTIGCSLLLTDVTDRQRREQRIDVLNRVLRHNLRNKLSVVIGRSALLADKLDDEDAAATLGSIDRAADDMLALAEKARAYETAIREATETSTVLVAEALHAAVDIATQEHPDAAVDIAVDEQLSVETNERLFQLTVMNLVENAIVHNDSEPRVEVGAVADADGITVTVSDNGPGIDSTELAVIEEGEETALGHGSGIGLWLVTWSVERLGGTVAFESTNPGTRVEIAIPDRNYVETIPEGEIDVAA